VSKGKKAIGLLAPAALALTLATPHGAVAQGQGNGTMLAGDTPRWVGSATAIGAADPTTIIDFTVWLKLQNENKLQQTLRDLYTPGNANYHKFLNSAQFQSSYSPSKGNLNAVTQYLSNKGFTVLSSAENNFYVRAEGTVAQISNAFHVSINNYNYHGQTQRSNASDPTVDGSLNGVISDITGLDDAGAYNPDLRRPAGRDDNGTSPATALKYNALCGDFNTTKALTLTGGSTATYKGFVPCGYGATQLRKAYGVDQALASGIDGTGQSVAIVDAYGSPTILQDANAYSKAYGLPQLVDGQNFQEVTPAGIVNKPESKSQDPLGWQAEVTLDVEMVHAMAPGAKIVLVASPNNYTDLDEAVNYVVVHHSPTSSPIAGATPPTCRALAGAAATSASSCKRRPRGSASTSHRVTMATSCPARE